MIGRRTNTAQCNTPRSPQSPPSEPSRTAPSKMSAPLVSTSASKLPIPCPTHDTRAACQPPRDPQSHNVTKHACNHDKYCPATKGLLTTKLMRFIKWQITTRAPWTKRCASHLGVHMQTPRERKAQKCVHACTSLVRDDEH
jgi:hypothetical protein